MPYNKRPHIIAFLPFITESFLQGSIYIQDELYLKSCILRAVSIPPAREFCTEQKR